MSVKRIALIAGLGVIFALIAASMSVYSYAHRFFVEDRIHGTFYPVAMALFDYQHDHNAPAANLRELVPKYISEIPSSPLIDSVRYSVINQGKDWQLDLHSNALSPPRIYCCRSTDEFSPEEEHRVLIRYHALWTVLRD